jgi:hypothetical protein
MTYNTGKVATLKKLNEYTQEDLKRIEKVMESILLYKNTLKKDFEIAETKINTPDVVYKMYKQNQYSILYFYYYFSRYDGELSRIKQREVNKVKFFMEHFPEIKEYIDSL